MTNTPYDPAPPPNAGTVKRLRELAADLQTLGEWLARHAEDAPAVYVAGTIAPAVYLSANTAEEFAAAVRWMTRGSSPDSPVQRDPIGERMFFDRRFGSFTVTVGGDRANVCERVVTGTTIVRRPDPSYPAPPLVDVEEEVVEWRCSPILSVAHD